MTGSSDDGREDGTGSIVTSEPGFAHTGPIVDHESSHVVVAHFDFVELVVVTFA